MNLAIEYLLRTDAIRNFFQTPCSLCLNHKFGMDKRLVLLEEVDDSYRVTHFYVCDLDGSFPSSEAFDIPKNDLYSSPKVIVPNYRLLKYHDSPINTRLNSYREPMNSLIWRQTTSKLLNSQLHRRKRNFWLWRCFSEQVLASSYDVYPKSELEDVFAFEQARLKRYPRRWEMWTQWKSKMLTSGPAATELIFQECYPQRTTWTSSSSSSSSCGISDRDTWQWVNSVV